MLVHQVNRSCNMCNKSKDSEILDLPFEEIKLSPFAVKCDCGYFHEAYHYAVSYHKWRIAKSTIKHKLEYARSDLRREKEYIKENPSSSDYVCIELQYKKEAVIKLHAQWDEISLTPIPDHLWKD